MSPPSLRQNAGLLLVLLAALLATAVKVAWALHSAGSCDVVFFFEDGKALGRLTLAQVYANDPMFNHPPATALLVTALYRLARADYPTFAALFRFVEIAADLGTIAALLWLRRRTGRPPWWALVLFAASPVSIMVSGFHGNVDPLMVLFLTWAAAALLARRPALCGALFAAACNVKVMPLALAPVFLAWWWQHDRRGLARFSAAAGALLLAGSAVPLLRYPGLFLHNVLGYGGYWGSWGITYWLQDTGFADFQKFDFQGLSAAQVQIAWLLKAVVVGTIAALAWRRRAVEGAAFFTTLTAAFALVFVFAPGAGPQYLVWAAPFLAWSAPGWSATVTVCSAVFMASFYHSTADWHFPWDLAYPNGWEYIFWGPWTNLPWMAFVLLLAVQARRWWRAEGTVRQ
ncbi:MAG TPA: glycosyltransferase 87 family protein [Chthoniobacteraceae bacterium]|jgi:hypothetical protein|nr:glycosyltransferase 87 family protein [Chthoniobacteraceae bacterium]